MRPLLVHRYSQKGKSPLLEDAMAADPEAGWYCVADGMGGAHAGVQSAALATRALADYLGAKRGDSEATLPYQVHPEWGLEQNLLANSFWHAHREIQNFRALENVAAGASLGALWIGREGAWVAQVGSVGIFCIRGGQVVGRWNPRTLAPIGTWSVPREFLGQKEDPHPLVSEVSACQPGDWWLVATAGIADAVVTGLAELSGRGDEIEGLDRRIQLFFESYEPRENASAVVVVLGSG